MSAGQPTPPPSQVQHIFDAISTQLAADLTACGVTELPTLKLGKKHLYKQTDRNSIVIWAGRAVISGSTHQGNNPNHLHTRGQVLYARVWAADYGPCEVLAQQLVQAVREVTVGSYKLTGWDAPAGDDDNTRRGEQIVVTFELSIPIVGWTLATVTNPSPALSP